MSSPRTLIHGAALLGFTLLILLPLLILGARQPGDAGAATTIALEHAAPVTLFLTVKRAREGILFEMGGASDAVHVSVPLSWQRREVWGVPVASVTAEGEGFGFARWRLPPKGSMAFFAPLSPSSLVLHNPADSHLTLKLTLLDLEKNRTDTRTILVEKESQKTLW